MKKSPEQYDARNTAIRQQYEKLIAVVSVKAALMALETDHGLGPDRIKQIAKQADK